jgi:hypothetical protein
MSHASLTAAALDGLTPIGDLIGPALAVLTHVDLSLDVSLAATRHTYSWPVSDFCLSLWGL